ncbi:MAG: hypothetical protein FD176_1682 [Rhodospirillaceae bacterium]|nr:MAG: hypothetical protein FD176_1682 [Rhodospirillaceae bacterium]TNC97652.1 MAG: Uncharacterized protein FD119_640 [Stygiobacter sp.]
MHAIVFATLTGLAVPAAALVLTAPTLVLDARRQGRSSGQTLDRIGQIVAAGRLIHELQRERGLSVGYLSKATEEYTSLSRQIVATDESLAAFHRIFPDDVVSGALDGLDAHRQRIHHRQLLPAQAAMGYGGRIGVLLDLIAHGVKSAARGRLARLGTAYLNLVSAKEAAGQERAHLTAALSAPTIEGASRRRAHDLREHQDMLLRLFADGAGAELAGFSQAALADPERVVNALREAALAEDAVIQRPTAALWFEAATRRIDALKEVEMRLESTLLAAATATSSRAGRNLRVIAGAVLGALGLLGGLASTVGAL